MDKKTRARSVHIPPTDAVLAEIHAEMRLPPRVYAYEVATELGCSESAISKHLNRGDRLPHGHGPRSLMEAVKRIRSRKRVAA